MDEKVSLGNLKDLLALNLSSNNMGDSLPPEIGKLKAMIQIDLSMNQFSNGIPREIGGILRNGTPIAVKVFNQKLEAIFKSFDKECEVLRSLLHKNLIRVITSCSNINFKALVLEYMPKGSLDKWLYSHNYFLDIMQRLSIMIDVACPLEYLHHGCPSSVIHYDLKPSNGLLDENMVAYLRDFGISKLLGEDESDLYTKTLATLGYIAPGSSFGLL
ncbi:putative leucine-rich repeat receptor-like serine/threonine-protein kinase At2g24130 [Lycium barbarum]|uniref:putative leucine-rich repeat receptor-like serine/threonine-protein kinase At2g24130 n=1 Tax=Lycium barbarum TaxID=112863 RepID=UPI00293ECB3B|nr:putative leucine-rich repeat receptor-like serine/threonine-protein kinase At2g24130 [Lycium barbarum]